MKNQRISQYFDADLSDIERGRPDGLLDSFGGIYTVFLVVAIIVVGLARHFGY